MPPKIARRKRQLKEPSGQSEHAATRKGDEGEGDEEEDEDEDEAEEEKPTGRASKSAANGAASSSSQGAAVKEVEDDRVWVQCNTCDKWRALPNTVDPALLPDIWFCELNTYDDNRNDCEVSHFIFERL
jgi:hypothetical protein